MSSDAILISACFNNLSVSLSFSALYFKGGYINNQVKTILIFIIINLAMISAGLFFGSTMLGLANNLSLQVGLALMIVVAFKIIIRGWKTKPSKRIYDIRKLPMMIWLFIALSIDTFLFCVAIVLITEISIIKILLMMFCFSITGIATGIAVRKRAPLLLPNVLELLIGVAILVQGVFLFFL